MSLVLHSMVYIFLSQFVLLEHLVKSMTLIIEIKFKMLNFLCGKMHAWLSTQFYG